MFECLAVYLKGGGYISPSFKSIFCGLGGCEGAAADKAMEYYGGLAASLAVALYNTLRNNVGLVVASFDSLAPMERHRNYVIYGGWGGG